MKLRKNELFATPCDMKALQDWIEGHSAEEKPGLYVSAMMAWNLACELSAQPEPEPEADEDGFIKWRATQDSHTPPCQGKVEVKLEGGSKVTRQADHLSWDLRPTWDASIVAYRPLQET